MNRLFVYSKQWIRGTRGLTTYMSKLDGSPNTEKNHILFPHHVAIWPGPPVL